MEEERLDTVSAPEESAGQLPQAAPEQAGEAQAGTEQAGSPLEQFLPHFRELERQAQALAEQIPGFDLRQELRNPVFARLTMPGSGVGVEDAFFAVHRRELQEAAMRSSAQRTAEKLARSIQAGNLRPRENGAAGQGPSVTGFDYRTATREQRESLKRRIRDAAARGDKVYPR